MFIVVQSCAHAPQFVPALTMNSTHPLRFLFGLSPNLVLKEEEELAFIMAEIRLVFSVGRRVSGV